MAKLIFMPCIKITDKNVLPQFEGAVFLHIEKKPVKHHVIQHLLLEMYGGKQ